MADNGEKVVVAAPGAAFAERHVEADGFRIRYLEAGQGDRLRGARLRPVFPHEQFVVNRTSTLLTP